ncbi:N-6 DNA methylase [Ligilactobacillus ruminis]|uniref:class I SAM-dependent DNA methyltransferase n=1 Tax=Ligilactobacillus ruminis TaxID=1623 RepID=UPI003F94E6F1
MITGTIKNKIDKIWKDIWASGLTQPITVIEQITYLMFIRSLDQKDIDAEAMENLTGQKQNKIFPETPEGQRMRWSKFKDRDAVEIFDIIQNEVFPFIKEMTGDDETAFSKYMKDASLGFTNPGILSKTINSLDELYKDDIKSLDMQGDLYEYMLSKLSVAGQNGQFRTPKQIRDMMVQLRKPSPDDMICDPACGTAGFLISAAEYIRERYPNMTDKQWKLFDTDTFSGFETDPTMLRISAMNLMLHSITRPEVKWQDSISKNNEIKDRYDLILANPPFTGTVDEENINPALTRMAATKKTELLFVNEFVRMLKVGGRCACIVPDGVVFGTSKAHKATRKELVENQLLEAVISLPSGVFRPYSDVSTSILIFTKTNSGGTENVWFYDMQADGFSLDDKREEVEENDIPDIINRFANLEAEKDRSRKEKSFMVSKEDIAKNGYSLRMKEYKEIEYQKIDYPSSEELLNDVDTLKDELVASLQELRGLLS